MDNQSAPSNNYRWQPGWAPAIFAFVVYSLIVLGIMKTSGIGYDEFTRTAHDVYRAVVVSLAAGAVFLVAFVSWLRWDFVWRDPKKLAMNKLLWAPPVIMVLGIILRFASVTWSTIDWDVVLAILCAGVLVGFTEEILFRGIWLRSMRVGGRNEGQAALFTTIAFGLFHLPNILVGGGVATFGQLFLAACTGFGLYLWRRGFGWIVPAMIAHGVWDMSTFITQNDRAPSDSGLTAIAFLLYGLGLVVSFVTIIYVWRKDKATRWQREGVGFDPDAPLIENAS